MKPDMLRAMLGLLLATAACGKEPYSGPVTGKVLLRYRPPAGSHYPYAFSQVSTIKAPNGPMASMGEQPITLAMWFTQQVGPTVGNGSGIQVSVMIDSAHITSPLVGNDVAGQLAGAKTTLVVDDHLRVVHAEPVSPLSQGASQVAAQLMASLKTINFALPDSAVGPGDTWTTPLQVPYSEFAGGRPVYATTTMTVKSLEVVKGDTVAGLTLRVDLPDKPMPIVMFGQRGTLALSGTITGDQRFSLTRGAVLATTYGGTVVVTVKGGMVGPSGMNVNIGQQASLTLLGEKGAQGEH